MFTLHDLHNSNISFSNRVILEDIQETYIRTFSGVKTCTTIKRDSNDFVLFRNFIQFFIILDLLYLKNGMKFKNVQADSESAIFLL